MEDLDTAIKFAQNSRKYYEEHHNNYERSEVVRLSPVSISLECGVEIQHRLQLAEARVSELEALQGKVREWADKLDNASKLEYSLTPLAMLADEMRQAANEPEDGVGKNG